VAALVEKELQKAQKKGRPYIMFVHGSSTSRPGKTTARSVVRQFMRSPDATPLIERNGCIQHNRRVSPLLNQRNVVSGLQPHV
jgi:hypothetical protein